MARNQTKHKAHRAKPIRLDAPTDTPTGPSEDAEEHAPSDETLRRHKPTKQNVRAMRGEE